MTAGAVERTTAPPRSDPPGGVPLPARLVLLLGCLVLAAAAWVSGERQSDFRDLEHAVAAGEVTEVRIGGGLGESAHGFATVEVHWRSGLVGHMTQVIEARPRSQAPAPGQRDDGVSAVLGQDVGTRLLARQPGLRIERVGFNHLPVSVAGWYLPGWTIWVALALFLGTLVSMVSWLRPWRATRWAWFWLVLLAAPVGIPAYALLSGPTPLVPAPRDAARRLTGGWAFLLALVLSSIVKAGS